MKQEEKNPSIIDSEVSNEPASDEQPAEQTSADSAQGESTVEAEKDPVTELLNQITQLQEEVKALKEKNLRSIADSENFRKRALREKDDARRFATQPLVEELLPVIDNFSMGLKAAQSHEGGEAFTKGFAMILTQIKNVLQQNGVVEINPQGEAFDPNLHESISYQPSNEVEEGQVLSVERVGYSLHQRLIRPASVVVSQGVPKAEPAENQA